VTQDVSNHVIRYWKRVNGWSVLKIRGFLENKQVPHHSPEPHACLIKDYNFKEHQKQTTIYLLNYDNNSVF
jgi:hypothetical protein